MALTPGPRTRRSPLRPVRNGPGLTTQQSQNVDHGLNQSFTSLDEHVIRMRTLRSSPRRRSSILSTGEISLLGSPGMSPDSSFDTSFGSDISSLSISSSVSSRTPITAPLLQAENIRKRLQMSPAEDLNTSTPKGVTPTKRKRSSKNATCEPDVSQRLEALSKDQLICLLDTLTINHPEIKREIEELLPIPDISPLLENLEYCRHNVYKSLPHSKWGSSRDAFCYRRVATHLENFKSACISQGKQLLDSSSWEACIEYTIKATEYVDRLPDWDNAAHNKIKQHCLRGVTTQCKSAIKHSALSKSKYWEIKAQILDVLKLSKEFASCLSLVEKKMQKLK